MGTTTEKLNHLKGIRDLQQAYLNEQGKNVTDETPFREFLEHFKSLKPNLQDKSVSITSNGSQTVKADEGYDGLNSVAVTTNIQPVFDKTKQFDSQYPKDNSGIKTYTLTFPKGKTVGFLEVFCMYLNNLDDAVTVNNGATYSKVMEVTGSHHSDTTSTLMWRNRIYKITSDGTKDITITVKTTSTFGGLASHVALFY